MIEATRVRDNLWCLDLHFGGETGVIAAYLIHEAGEYALVETGPTSTIDALEWGIRSAGVAPSAISKLLVTHIHLDHAGAAGSLLARYPNMHLFVHERGARHMQDPTKLIASAQRIYGDRMGELWGDIVPVPAERMTSLSDDDVVRIGETSLSVAYTPGHASHHVAYVDEARKEVFTGDVAEIRLQGADTIRPATPPPDVDLELWTESLRRLVQLRTQRLHLTHFGSYLDVDHHLAEAERQLLRWAAYIENSHAQGIGPDDLKAGLQIRAAQEVVESGGDDETIRRYDLAAPTGMSVDGLLRYYRKRSELAP